ncbi:hypothetical protein [uncultured Roseovarius sp.]|uniref:hypothetical protein n=1 Tax=uncultured Roseovarius sp. TaxID=293344 RepID=UPI0026150F6F|nr:hypothetical protein [uncultured Roseovarius sp.]
MRPIKAELDRLHDQIGQTHVETRYHFEPELRQLIELMRAEGVAVPDKTKRLHETLLCEAIEAQFDNMPV